VEEAVHRMTSFPAERVGLPKRGRLAASLPAALVLLDPQTVADNMTPEQPNAPPAGIRAELLGGEVVACDGQVVQNERRSQVLRRP